MVERQLEMVEGFDESLRHSGKNYALPKVWTVPVSDDLVFTLASDCFFFRLDESVVVSFMFGYVFAASVFKNHVLTCWVSHKNNFSLVLTFIALEFLAVILSLKVPGHPIV